MPSKRQNKIIGQAGEDAACRYLEKHGWKILEKNYRYSRVAEIDIVAKDKDTIVFVEVKTRTTTAFGHPFEAINRTKLYNVFKAGLDYLQHTTETYDRYRIDVIALIGNLEKGNPKIEHLKDVSLN